jgi:hypothetical protein
MRPFTSWKEFAEYCVFLGVCVAGIFHASLLWPVIGALILLLLGWQRYDGQYRELAQLAHDAGNVPLAFRLFMRARLLIIVLGVKIGHDSLFTVGAYLFGMAIGWFWGVP